MRVRFRIAVLSLLIALPAMGELQITFEGDVVVASQVTPFADVAWFSVAREAQPFQAVMVRREAIVTDATGTGTVSFDVGKAVPPCSIWVAVDLKTGEFAVAAPPDEPLREVGVPPGALRNGPNGRLNRFVQDTHLLEVFVARPGTGAWVATLTDQDNPSEVTPGDGTVAVGLERLESVGATKAAPTEFLAGDVVVAIDPEQMTVAAVHAVGPKK
jgi:hypothetical protein